MPISISSGWPSAGDAWEFAEAMTALAYRCGIDYIIYSMTH